MLGRARRRSCPPPTTSTRFVERAVRLGPRRRGSRKCSEGVKPGERVVTEGSFLLRAESGANAVGRDKRRIGARE